ncbi:MAG: hypothetical protein AB7E45_00655 [Candidatus Caldatribacteriota bacterium]
MPKGDYYHQKFGGRNLKTYYARQTFWCILEKRAPKTLKYLKKEILPIYNELFPEDYSSTCGTLNLMRLRWKRIGAVNIVCRGHLTPLIEVINKWSERFNLHDDWIKDKLLKTLADWRNNPPKENEKLYYYGIEVIIFASNKPIPYSFKTKDWNFSLETWGDAKKRITLDFKTSLDQYKKEKEELAKKSGLVKTRFKRKLDKQIRWLIDYQVYGKSFNNVTDSESKKRANGILSCTIERGIKQTAKLLGIKLRKEKIHFKE